MKYFLHDCNSFNDEKISELFLNFGYEGLGLFYTILEKIGSQEKPVKTIVLKSQLKVGKRLEKCWKFMEEIGIISSNNGDTFNERILSYSETYQIKKEKNREKISEWREKQTVIKNVTSYEPVSNLPKVNKSKVNKSKEEIQSLCFPNFTNELFYKTWDILLKEKKWKNKSPAALQKCLDHLGKNTESDAIEMMNNTIAGDWQGLFDLKKEKYAKGPAINSKQLGTYQLLQKIKFDRESNDTGKANFGS